VIEPAIAPVTVIVASNVFRAPVIRGFELCAGASCCSGKCLQTNGISST